MKRQRGGARTLSVNDGFTSLSIFAPASFLPAPAAEIELPSQSPHKIDSMMPNPRLGIRMRRILSKEKL